MVYLLLWDKGNKINGKTEVLKKCWKRSWPKTLESEMRKKVKQSKASCPFMWNFGSCIEKWKNNLITFMPNTYHFTYEFLTLILFFLLVISSSFEIWFIVHFQKNALWILFHRTHGFLFSVRTSTPFLCAFLHCIDMWLLVSWISVISTLTILTVLNAKNCLLCLWFSTFHNMGITLKDSWSVLIGVPVLYGSNLYFLVIVKLFTLKRDKEP